MTLSVLVPVIIVLAIWAVAVYAVWHWGPGLRTRAVWCPVFRTEAKVLADQKEAAFRNSYAGLQVVDIRRCSLFGADPLKCHKDCFHLAPRGVATD